MSNKKKDKTINDHSVLIDKIRREYLELYKENQNLKLTIQNYERYYNDQQLDNLTTTAKDKHIFQKNTIKEKEDIKNLITLLAAKPKMKNYISQKGN